MLYYEQSIKGCKANGPPSMLYYALVLNPAGFDEHLDASLITLQANVAMMH